MRLNQHPSLRKSLHRLSTFASSPPLITPACAECVETRCEISHQKRPSNLSQRADAMRDMLCHGLDGLHIKKPFEARVARPLGYLHLFERIRRCDATCLGGWLQAL